jgi:hypothetical protein
VLADPEITFNEANRIGGVRSILGVPLLREGNPIGTITVTGAEPSMFSERQIAMLQTFADQAVIAIENTRLINEQQEALEQQTATADVLRAINASPGELAPVFDVIGEKAIKLCDAAAGALMLPDGDRFKAVALGGVPEAYAEFCRNSPAYGRPNPGSLQARMLAGADIVHIPYKGAGPGITDLVSGHIPMMSPNVTAQILELHRAGKIRILAVNAAERLSAAPDIPTAIEEGVPGMIGLLFLGLFAPAATPKPIVDRIAAASRAAMADAEFQKVLIAQGLEAIPDSDSEKAKLFMDEEIARWAPVVKASGFKVE